MKKKNYITRYCTIAILLIIVFSCNIFEDDVNKETFPKIDEYHPTAMFYPSIAFPDTNSIRLLYTNDNKLSQRLGCLINTYFGYRFYEFIGDTISYYNDSIVVRKKLLNNKDFEYLDEYKSKFILNNGLIIKEFRVGDVYNETHRKYDTLLYSYNKKKQVEEITQITYYPRKKSWFKYDENGNLNLIISEKYYRNTPEFRDTMWFLDYDNSPNLAKNLNIFQECFYRSLSTNNFREYIHKSYRLSDSMLVSTENRRWEFPYDENNYPIYKPVNFSMFY